MRTGRLGGLTIKAALGLGFGLTLGVWAFAGWYFTGRVAAIQRDAEAVNTRYIRAQELLSTIRSEVLTVSLAIRDALLEPDRQVFERARPAANATFARIDGGLARYEPVFDQAERTRIDELRVAMADLRVKLVDVL